LQKKLLLKYWYEIWTKKREKPLAAARSRGWNSYPNLQAVGF